MTPGEIDAYVRAQSAAGADLYHLQRDALAGLDPDLVLTLDDVLETIRTVGAHAGVPERADALVTHLRARLDAVAAAVAGRPRLRVAIVEWVDPPFAAGHWVPDLVTA
jgi:iron complex transport system substrate-binding protein